MTKDEALEMALEALEYWDVHGKLHQPTEEAITAVKKALAQPEQEPVEWPRTMERGALVQWLHLEMVQHTLDEGTIDKLIEDAQAIPATPPQRSKSSGKPSAWVGLTDEEIGTIAYNVNTLDGIRQFSRAIEAKLKKKNGFAEEST